MYSVSFKYGEQKQFDTLAKACSWATKQFTNHKEWAQRFNRKALVEIERCETELSELKAFGLHDGAARIVAELDDLTGAVAELTIVDFDDVQPKTRRYSSAAKDSAA